MSKRTIISLLFSVSTLAGCTTNLTATLTFSGSTVEAPAPLSGSTNGGLGGVSLAQVLKNKLDPNGTLDLVGDGSGAIGNLCRSTSGSQTPKGATNCNCTFSYNTASYPNQSIDTPTTYREANLIRCAYTAVPSGVTSFSVSIHETNSNSYSNQVSFNPSSGTTGGNTSLASNFVSPLRYQCRDAVTIPFQFDDSVYDPIQSEDPHLSYPLNFYATNLGYVTSILGSTATVGWICPPILNPSYLTRDALAEFNSAYQSNMNIYSIGPDRNNSYFIYSPTGDNKRSTFYLSKSKTSVFNIPIDAYIAPNTNTSPTGSYPPLGYGAAPIPSGSGQEVCPSQIPIPGGFQWVKVWQFRAGLPQRKFAMSTNVMNIGAIYCNPGDWLDSNGVQQPIFQGCFLEKENRRHSSPYSLSVSSVDNSTTFFADRVLSLGGGNTCVRLQENDGTAPCASAGGGSYHPGAGCLNGADLWEEQDPFTWDGGKATTNTTYTGYSACSNVPILDPVNSCSTANQVHTDPKGSAQHPYTFNVQYQDYDTIQGDGSGRYDFIFVVSPQSVMLQDMKNTTSSSSTLAYQPYRYYTNLDCNPGIPSNSDPSRPDGNCNSTNIIHYGLTLQDVGSNGDTPANSTTNPPIFPVCALQPT